MFKSLQNDQTIYSITHINDMKIIFAEPKFYVKNGSVSDCVCYKMVLMYLLKVGSGNYDLYYE